MVTRLQSRMTWWVSFSCCVLSFDCKLTMGTAYDGQIYVFSLVGVVNFRVVFANSSPGQIQIKMFPGEGIK
jgi:hypothetical protein